MECWLLVMVLILIWVMLSLRTLGALLGARTGISGCRQVPDRSKECVGCTWLVACLFSERMLSNSNWLNFLKI
jgi:hypothetical protein